MSQQEMTTHSGRVRYEGHIPPSEPAMPVSLRIEPSMPRNGWWNLDLFCSEESFDDCRVIPWNTTDRDRRGKSCTIHCSDVWDPIPGLYDLVMALRTGDEEYISWSIDEEGPEVALEFWFLDVCTVQVVVRSEHRLRGDFHYCFVADRKNLHDAFSSAYEYFAASGGWHRDSYWAGYGAEPDDDDREAQRHLAVDAG